MANYVLLEKFTVNAAGASSVTFSNIPQTGYTDLKVVFSGRETSNTGSQWINASLRFNGSSTGYSSRVLYGSNGGTGSTTGGSTEISFLYSTSNTATANTYASTEFYIPNYTSSNFKSVSADTITENNGSPTILLLNAGVWSNTAAITSITLTAATSFAQHSTFYLYGVAKLGTSPKISPFASGGDRIITDGNYWYHTFTSSGTFTPLKALSNVDYLVVAGGGGGNSYGAGGGAGGLRSTVTATGGGGSLESKLSLAKDTNYTVTIGAGGSEGNTGSPWTSYNGSNSTFSTITSIGGGGVNAGTGQTGGSGGGGVFAFAGAAGTANQGYASGPSQELANYPGSGGGGAGGMGLEGGYNSTTGTRGGNGGPGVAISALAIPTGTGVSNYYAGGGAGGAWYNGPGGSGGAGGGGNGGYGVTTPGVANTGSGGGGSGSSTGSQGSLSAGGAGGSGIVIVRYAV